MNNEAMPLTIGVDHVGLTVRDLELSRQFLCDCLGWKVAGGNPDYPAVFVTDGQTVLTLWQAEDPLLCTPFDRRKNVGLHHLALRARTLAGLDVLYARTSIWPGVSVEFAPQLSGRGPKTHFILREPSGIRIEFAFDPRV